MFANRPLLLTTHGRVGPGVPNMHLTCTNMDPQLVRDALLECRKEGITNIVALRGDAPEGESEWHANEGGESGVCVCVFGETPA